MRRFSSLACLAALGAWPLYAQNWVLLGEGYQLTADSAVDDRGNIYFTDARHNRILKIDLAGKISTWKEDSHGSHGVAFGPDGRWYAGQHDRKRIVAFSSDGTESVIAEGVQTHHLTVTARNDIYCTDAPAGKVWLVDARGRTRVVREGMNWPRGVRVSPDQSLLLVAEVRANRIWSFQIQKDGSLMNGRLDYHLDTRGEPEADVGGMAFDSKGFLYVATKFGVQVFDREGHRTATIDPPGKEGLDIVLFAGPGLQWLYVMDGDRVYRRPAAVR